MTTINTNISADNFLELPLELLSYIVTDWKGMKKCRLVCRDWLALIDLEAPKVEKNQRNKLISYTSKILKIVESLKLEINFTNDLIKFNDDLKLSQTNERTFNSQKKSHVRSVELFHAFLKNAFSLVIKNSKNLNLLFNVWSLCEVEKNNTTIVDLTKNIFIHHINKENIEIALIIIESYNENLIEFHENYFNTNTKSSDFIPFFNVEFFLDFWKPIGTKTVIWIKQIYNEERKRKMKEVVRKAFKNLKLPVHKNYSSF